MQDTGTFGVITPDGETRALVRAAIAELDPADGEISELHLRHGLYGADLADILGVSRGQAHALAARARSRFEKSLGVLLLARSERQHCQDLSAILDEEGGSTTRSLRRRVKRHIGRCEVCGVRKRGGLNPAILLGLLPAVPMPAELRRQTLRLIADRSPAAVAYRAQVMKRAAASRADGFPTQVTTPAAPELRFTAVVAVAAAAVALALLGAAMYYAGHPAGGQAAVRAIAGRHPPITGSAGPAGPERGTREGPAGPRPRPVRPRAGPGSPPGPDREGPFPRRCSGSGGGGPSSRRPPGRRARRRRARRRRRPSRRHTAARHRSSPSASSAPPPSSAPPTSAPPSSPDPSPPASSSAPPTDVPPATDAPPSATASSSSSSSATGGLPG